MAFRTQSVSVNTTPTLLVEAQAGDVDAWVNGDQNEAYYIGGDDVTTGNGLRLFGPAQIFHTRLRPGDELWGVVPSGTTPVNILVRSA